MTQDIKELLELAAKACGYEVFGYGGDDKCVIRFADIGPDDVVEWSPHLDDGDGARMEAQLGVEFKWKHLSVTATAVKDDAAPYSNSYFKATCIEFFLNHNGDRQAARRMASLRVAAEVGRRMK